VAATWAVSALLFIWFRARAYGKRELFAKAAGSANCGAAYAFTIGMLPWAKESIRENMLSYAMGIAYHVGIFTAFAFTALSTVCHILSPTDILSILSPTGIVMFVPEYQRYFLVIHEYQRYFLVPVLFMGTVSGISLFIKRIVNPTLRGISCPDDYISNFLATSFVAFTLLVMFGVWLTPWSVCTIVLLAYIPFSKIRHCLFFFSTRYHFGAFFGRRGCMPPSK
jgi:hypothetical protein